ncbi:MAG: hypothetical protein FWH41_04790, partial [Treponema sp.]|nr:hypothetical protein [Treponema sp.]
MKRIVFFTMLAVCSNTVFAQTHNSVNLDSQVYHILEQAEIRGLCMPLSGVRPYTQNVIVNAINEILNSDKAGKLRRLEQEILEQYLEKYAKPQRGFDWQKGAFHGETAPEKKIPLSVNAGVNIDMEGSAGIYPSFEERYLGAEGWVQLFLNGDIGRNVSYEINAAGGLLKIPRFKLGKGNTYYDGFIDDPNKEFVNRETAVYSEPMTQFPYSYRKKW